MIRPEIWYRDELQVLLDLVKQQIKATNPSDVLKMVALGGLYIKLTSHLLTSPSAVTPEASA